VPVERIREDAAEEDTDGAAAGQDEPEDAHRLRPFGRLGEQGHDQRERDGGHDRAADSLDCPRRDQRLLRGREAAGERCEREQRDADQEQAARAEEITQPPAEEQETAEGEQIGVHDPRERFLGEAEILADRGERDVHDCPVEDDHQIAQAQDEQGKPAAAAFHGHRTAQRLRLGSIPTAV
jgi:hypothetical protein